MRHENVKDARRLDALVRLHSTVLDPDLEIRRWGEGVGQRSSRPLDKGGGGGGAVLPQSFSARPICSSKLKGCLTGHV